MNNSLVKPLNSEQIKGYFSPRPGEFKLGQTVRFSSDYSDYKDAYDSGCRYALIGVPEQIGPKANCGQGGAHNGWQACLSYFFNLQANSLFDASNILVVGEVSCEDFNSDGDLSELRSQCEDLDNRLSEALTPIFSAGLVPIVIGGGHNNAYPILRAASETFKTPLAVANLDPHSDFRAMEGRHSGNPFRYASEQGYLSHYAVLGLHEQKNNQDALDALDANDFPWFSVQQIFWRREVSFDQVLDTVFTYLLDSDKPIGVEIDLDAISEMPTSAITAAGVQLGDALYYIHRMAQLEKVSYLHLAEAAPERHPSGIDAGKRVTGQALAEMIFGFVKAHVT